MTHARQWISGLLLAWVGLCPSAAFPAQVFYGSGIFTPPNGVTRVQVIAVGGGGGGGAANPSASYRGGGGGSGYVRFAECAVTGPVSVRARVISKGRK